MCRRQDKPARSKEIAMSSSTHTAHTTHRTGVAEQIGKYSDAVEVAAGLRWLYTSGTPGLSPDGKLSTDFNEQARQTWENVLAALAQAGMGVPDIVKVSTSLTRAEDIPAYAKVRSSFLGDARPAFMLSIIQQVIRPEMLLEVEVIAARA
jgi:enamine deaminase RidA (YjgF/YER057c/UK114 family)